MSNDGKWLERIVTDFEGLLLGTGFTLTSNDKVYDDDGNQIAEFDLTIEGRVGSTHFKWLIECRDRPSKGAAPSSWIQHLAGRKQLFGFDKVIAVSTTGFSKGAQEAGRTLNISLREVAAAEDISKEFGTIEFRLQKLKLTTKDDAVDFGFPREAVGGALRLGPRITNPEARNFGEKEFIPLRQFVSREYLKNPTIKEPETPATLHGIFRRAAAMELRVGRQVLPFTFLEVPISVEFSFFPVTAFSVRSYGEDGSLIGQEVTLSIETTEETVRTVVLITEKDGEVVVVERSLVVH